MKRYRRPLRVLWPAMLLMTASHAATAADPQRTNEDEFNGLGWSIDHAGTPIDLSAYAVTWEDRFDRFDVVSDRISAAAAPAGTRWFSPGHPAAASADWFGPGNAAGHDVLGLVDDADGRHLRMSMLRDTKRNRWVGPALQTVDTLGKGYTQTYGYFEASIKLPDAETTSVQGLWPAFWTYTVNRYVDLKQPMVEFDIIELYGGTPAQTTNRQTHTSVHLVPNKLREPRDSDKRFTKGKIRTQPQRLFDGKWHRYGGMVTPEWIIATLDGVELCRFKNFPEARQPRYLLLDIDNLSGDQSPIGDGPYHVLVDDVRVWTPKTQSPTPAQ